MQVSSRGEKAKETKEEIEKALLSYCSQLGDFEVWGKNVQLTCPTHTGWSCKHGWFLCTTPTKCRHSMSMTGELKNKSTPQIFEYAKLSNLM